MRHAPQQHRGTVSAEPVPPGMLVMARQQQSPAAPAMQRRKVTAGANNAVLDNTQRTVLHHARSVLWDRSLPRAARRALCGRLAARAMALRLSDLPRQTARARLASRARISLARTAMRRANLCAFAMPRSKRRRHQVQRRIESAARALLVTHVTAAQLLCLVRPALLRSWGQARARSAAQATGLRCRVRRATHAPAVPFPLPVAAPNRRAELGACALLAMDR